MPETRSISVVIVDDELLARDLLEVFVRQQPEFKLVAKCRNTYELKQALLDQPVDLIFLDIQMPRETGIEFLRQHPTRPKVVLTTAYPDYALEGFNLDVIDYVLKPITESRFEKCMSKLKVLFELEEKARKFDRIQPEGDQFLILRSGYDQYKVAIASISHIESMGEYVMYYTDTDRFMVLQAMKDLETTLGSDQFMRCHRSYMVAVRAVMGREGHHLLVAGERIPVGKTHRKAVYERLKSEGF